MLIAIKSGMDDLVQLLYEYGFKLLPPDGDQEAAMQAAARTGNINILRFLLENGAEVERQGHLGKIPLALAVEGGYSNAVKYLLYAGASAEVTIDGNTTAIMFAAQNGMEDVLQMLLKYGASPTKGLESAVKSGQAACVQILLESPNGLPGPEECQSLLEHPLARNSPKIVQLLERAVNKSSKTGEQSGDTGVETQQDQDKLLEQDSEKSADPEPAPQLLRLTTLENEEGIKHDALPGLPRQINESPSSARPDWIILHPFVSRTFLDILLGAIIARPSEPLLSYIPLASRHGNTAASRLEDVVWERKSSIGSKSFMAALQSSKHEITTVKQLNTYQLPNPEAVFAALIKDHAEDVEQLLGRSGELRPQAFFVTRIMTVKGYQNTRKRTRALPTSVSIDLPVSVVDIVSRN